MFPFRYPTNVRMSTWTYCTQLAQTMCGASAWQQDTQKVHARNKVTSSKIHSQSFKFLDIILSQIAAALVACYCSVTYHNKRNCVWDKNQGWIMQDSWTLALYWLMKPGTELRKFCIWLLFDYCNIKYKCFIYVFYKSRLSKNWFNR